MIARKPAVLLACVAAAAALLLCLTDLQGQSPNAQMKLGGAFVGSGAGGLWNAIQIPLDPAGKTCAARISGIAMPGFAGLLAALQADTFSEMVGQEVMISRDTAKFTFIGYATAGTTVKGILVMTGEFQFQGPNEAVVTYEMKVFSPDADGNQDGLPDTDATPLPIPIAGVDTAKRVAP